VADLEFVQFHPTALVPRICHAGFALPLLTEALRGAGAVLTDADGKRFMPGEHPLAELAPRDVVARAIARRTQSGLAVFLDLRPAIAERGEDAFPQALLLCREAGYDPLSEPVPVTPAAHYAMGGILTDEWGRASLDGLWACGEVASTGVHGANRLASNSLLEALVCAHRAAQHATARPRPAVQVRIPTWQSGRASNPDEMVVVSHNWDEIRRCMWDYVGIVRTTKRLQRALKRIANLQEEIQQYYWDFIVTNDLLELRNIAMVAELIVRSALERPESRGLHYNLDYPNPDPAWAQRDTVSRRT
jgi:L-aspartate oxidase